MRVFMLALGTRGDFELFLTLGRELRARGHEVALGGSGFHVAAAREAGLGWEQVGVGTREELLSVLRSLSSCPDRAQRTYAVYRRWLRPQLAAGMGVITAAAAGTDYFISNLKLVLRRSGGVIPGAAVTYDPPAAVEDLAKYRTREHGGLILELVAMSKGLIDPEGRWGDEYHFTGFWVDQRRPAASPPAELEAFVRGGLPPVVLTMGSMVMFDAGELARVFATSLRLSGQRGVAVAGWAAGAPAPAGPVLCVDEAPYDWLFPRSSCVIHHGGCGTVAAVLRAGRPSVVLPQVTCQEHFARMLAREGLVTGIFDAQAVEPAALAAAIREAGEELPKCRAREWQNTLCAEGGVKTAADLIEAHWAAVRPGRGG
jgi:UDP:flavonoid glycosyltransferase YjiC (YdhE family)